MLSWQNLHQKGTLAVPCTLWWSPHCWWHPIQIWGNPALKLTIYNFEKMQMPSPFLAQIFFNIATVRLLLGPFWTKTMATWQSSGLPSVWITTFRPLRLEDWKVVEENLCTLFTAILLVSTCGIITCQRGCYMRVDHVWASAEPLH